MRLVAAIVCFVLVAAASAGQSPQADFVEELFSSPEYAGRISDDIFEDAKLDVPGLITKYGYPLEVHDIETEDGYILGVHRIPHGRDQNNTPDPDKPVVLVQHGLLSSSADWVLMGPGCGLAYILAEEGFDVWLGNARGNTYSRRHVKLNPNGILDTTFWEFSWDEIGNYDLPAMIDHILETTGKSAIHYIGHSQGTTAFFVMGSLKPEYNDKIISMQALAPVAYLEYNQNMFFKAISPYANNIEKIAHLVGIGEFMPSNQVMGWAGQTFCQDEVVFQPLCTNILFLIAGWNEEQFNATMFPLKLAHTPAGAAVRQIAHYGQSIANKTFRRYNFGLVQNRRVYGSRTAPDYDLSKVTAPVFLHFSDQDVFAHVKDVDRLWKELGRPVGKFRVQSPQFSHLDFMWGIDARTLVWNRAISLMRALDN